MLVFQGTVIKGHLMTGICNQLVEQFHTSSVLEWSAVSDNLKKKLQNKELESLCN